MTAPLDPVIAQIIPLLPLRDPDTMTPQSARDSLRALAAARAAVPPPPVASVQDMEVTGAASPRRTLPGPPAPFTRDLPLISHPPLCRRASARVRPESGGP